MGELSGPVIHVPSSQKSNPSALIESALLHVLKLCRDQFYIVWSSAWMAYEAAQSAIELFVQSIIHCRPFWRLLD